MTTTAVPMTTMWWCSSKTVEKTHGHCWSASSSGDVQALQETPAHMETLHGLHLSLLHYGKNTVDVIIKKPTFQWMKVTMWRRWSSVSPEPCCTAGSDAFWQRTAHRQRPIRIKIHESRGKRTLEWMINSPESAGRPPQPAPPPQWQRWSPQTDASWWRWGPPRPRSTPGCSPSPASGPLPLGQTCPGSWTGAEPSPEEHKRKRHGCQSTLARTLPTVLLDGQMDAHVHPSPCSRPCGSVHWCDLPRTSSHPTQSCERQGRTAEPHTDMFVSHVS